MRGGIRRAAIAAGAAVVVLGTGVGVATASPSQPVQIGTQASTATPHLYWTIPFGGPIREANLDGTGVTTIDSTQGDSRGVAVGSSHIYWVSNPFGATQAYKIMEANLDGTGATALVSGQGYSLGVAVNSSHIYWTVAGNIMEANLDGTGVTTLVSGQGAGSVAVDSSHIYWTTINSIMQANLDGTGVTTLVTGQSNPFGVAVDSSHIYWTAAAKVIEANLDGTGVTTLFSGDLGAVSMAVDSSHIYWADAHAGAIIRANLDGTGVTTLVTDAGGAPVGLAVGPLSATCTNPPNPPQNVQDNSSFDKTNDNAAVQVTWDAPAPTCDPVAEYALVPINARGTPGQAVDTVPASATSDLIGSLNLCTFYDFGVVAVGTDGQQSPVTFPSNLAFTTGPPKASPPVVTILLQGVNSSLPGGTWNALNTNYCTSLDGNNNDIGNYPQDGVLADLATNWLNVTSPTSEPDYTSPGAGNNLIDSAASTGGLVIPFSYNGVSVTGTPTSATVTVSSYGPSDVADSLPMPEAGLLNTEISEINALWPNAKIIVVGHSEGGLIAQQWWWLYGLSNPRGVVQVFSLDSPINGEYAATLCKSNNPQQQADCSSLIPFIGVSHKLLVHYANLWQNQAANDQAYLNADLVDHLYTPIITLGDPLFDLTDSGAGPVQGACDFSTQGTNIGWASQGLLSPACLFVGVDQVEIACGGDSACSDGNSGLFKVPGDLWVHSWVKNSPLTIASVMHYVTG